MDRPSEVTLLKLGGSLLTEKTGVDAVRPAVLARLAAEIAESAAVDGAPTPDGPPAANRAPAAAREAAAAAGEAAAAGPHPHRPRLVLAHGSGSFGHVAARRHGLAAGLRDAAQQPVPG